MLSVAKDQNGCRFLQRKFDEGGAASIGLVFPEVLDNLIELMVDPFGNYLIQKLLDRCSEEQRLQVHALPPSSCDTTGVKLRQTVSTRLAVMTRLFVATEPVTCMLSVTWHCLHHQLDLVVGYLQMLFVRCTFVDTDALFGLGHHQGLLTGW